MKRREFIAASAVLLVSPRRSLAQGTRRRLGNLVLGERSPALDIAFFDGLLGIDWVTALAA
jgi:putative ABC transport system substrate-binding protein